MKRSNQEALFDQDDPAVSLTQAHSRRPAEEENSQTKTHR